MKKEEKVDESYLNLLRQNSIKDLIEISSKTYDIIVLGNVYKSYPRDDKKEKFLSFIDFLLWILTKTRKVSDFEEIVEKYNEKGIKEFVRYYFKYYDDAMIRINETFAYCDRVESLP